MTMQDREVLEVLRDEPELLAIADAIHGAQAGTQAGRRGGHWQRRALLGAVAVAAVAAIPLFAPWGGSGRNPIIDRALAAVPDHGPVLHLVIRLTGETTRIELSTGRESAVPTDAELWADEDRGLFRVVTRRDGQVASNILVRTGEAIADPLFASFVSAGMYRELLASGRARVIRKGYLRGRAVYWLGAEDGPEADGRLRWSVAIDAESYRAVLIAASQAGKAVFRAEVVRLETVPRDEARFRGRKTSFEEGAVVTGPVVEVGPGRSEPRTSSTAARRALGRPPLWAGAEIGGRRLSFLEVGTVRATADHSARISEVVVRLGYGRASPVDMAYLEIEEATARAAAPVWRLEQTTAPPHGYLDLERSKVGASRSERVRWTGRLRARGLFVKIESWSRGAVIAAARHLRPIP